jgi:hypothetical protein
VSDSASPLPPSTTYFANLQGAQLSAALMQKVSQCDSARRLNGTLQKWRDAYDVQYGYDRDNQGTPQKRVRRDPKNPSVLKVNLNHWASILRSVVILVTSQQLALQAEAKDNASTGLSDAQRGTKALEDEVKSKGLGAAYKTWVRHAAAYGAGWLVLSWDMDKGPAMKNPPAGAVPRDPVTFQPKGIPREGGAAWGNPLPTDVFYDVRRRDAQHDWIIVARWVNKFELAAKFSDLAPKILNIGVDPEVAANRLAGWRYTQADSSSDLIPVYEFRHRKTPACSNGRLVQFLSDTLLLPPLPFAGAAPGALPYEDLFAFRLAPDEQDDSPEGSTSMFDLLAVQEALDAAVSTALSKQKAGLPILFNPEGNNVSKKQLETPFAVVEFKKGEENKPFMWSAAMPIDQDLQLMGALQKQMETLSGINSVVRGNPEEALKDGSGAALSLVQAQAILAQTNLQQNALEGISHAGTAYLWCHKRFNVGGFSQAQGLKSFTGSDLDGTSGVRAQPTNALQQTVAGRQQILESLMKLNVSIDPDRLLEFLGTGNWETAIEDKIDEQILIKSENEQFAAGKVPPSPLVTQHHLKHLRGHLAEFGDPAKWAACAMIPDPTWQPPVDPMTGAPVLGPNGQPPAPPMMPAVLVHILDTLKLWREADPAILAAMNCPPPPPPPMPPGMAPAGPPPPGAPAGAPPKPGGPPPPPPPAPGPSSMPGNMPHMPTLPNGQPSSAHSPTPPGVHP